MTTERHRIRALVRAAAALAVLAVAVLAAVVPGGSGSQASHLSLVRSSDVDTGSTSKIALNQPVVGMASTPSGNGYWLVASDGGIFTTGDALFYGSTGNIALNQPVVGMAATPSGNGYWLVASDGGIFAFGDAGFHGSTGNIVLNQPVVGMAATPSGNGYWLVASDGGIFAFGDAGFHGSTGNIVLNQPVVGMAAIPSGNGYWLVASDGGIFSFGDADFFGSTGNIALNQPIVGMAAIPSGNGYWFVASDGGIFSFGDALFYGSTGDITLDQPIVGMAAMPRGNGYWFVASDGGIFTYGGVRYLAWVWQFSIDGSPEDLAEVLAEHNLGIIVKTHNGTDWMARYDSSPHAVSGPGQVRVLAQYFEKRGVPFHAYAVLKGIDPVREAQMTAQVLAAGARSVFLDLEPWQGYWQGTPQAATAFGRELRRLQPHGSVVTTVEPRPWALEKLPLAEFASFSNAFASLIYWETFSSQANLDLFEAYGWPTGPGGMTPEFLLDVSAGLLQQYNLPIQPVGQGASPDMAAWARFIDDACRSGMPDVSVWRYGVTNPGVWDLLEGRTSCP